MEVRSAYNRDVIKEIPYIEENTNTQLQIICQGEKYSSNKTLWIIGTEDNINKAEAMINEVQFTARKKVLKMKIKTPEKLVRVKNITIVGNL